jgi:hypothetical protein
MTPTTGKRGRWPKECPVFRCKWPRGYAGTLLPDFVVGEGACEVTPGRLQLRRIDNQDEVRWPFSELVPQTVTARAMLSLARGSK